jgi:hypothetical protein
MPLADAWFRYVRAEQNDGLGRFWVATSQDVRVFDGVRWTVFTPTEMGLGESSAEDLMPDLGITVLDSGEAWVHDCLWGGPGPMGGRGVRWFDGQTWHSADAPISTGCATVIRQDSAGRIWLGVGPDLWRYDPAAGEWVTFRPTETPPFGAARYGVVRDVVPDSSTGAWVTFLLCGGASCDTDVIYHLHGGIWAQLTDQPGYGGQQKLVLDASGDPWLFWQGGIYRVTDDVPELVGEMAPDIASVTADAAGQIWFVAPDQGRDTLWTLSP